MEILGIEKVSFVDFDDKICATIFTGGCNFLCPFCHNSGIVKRAFKPYDEKEILDYLQSRTKLLDAVTISGGEPSLQKDLKEFVSKVKKMGYLVKLDTNGTNPEVVKNLIEKKLIDYVAMDIKNNFDDYSQITGVKNPNVEKIKETLNYLTEKEFPFELRTTLVKQFHTEENIKKLASDLNGQKKLFLQKFVNNESCFSSNLDPVPKAEVEKFKDILSETIKNVYLRGY